MNECGTEDVSLTYITPNYLGLVVIITSFGGEVKLRSSARTQIEIIKHEL